MFSELPRNVYNLMSKHGNVDQLLFFLILASSQVSAIVSCLLGPERAEKIKIFAGDVVPKKKPDPVRFTNQPCISIHNMFSC